ncbi:1,2-phenylacetyl-CoA epoxidase subunit PaaC [Foetidibacter luteolus]|uniref:1,2-phenylacetyl-CoA epoxidase subunit PaaC n=1 Tax=Foetidibacter luteolus TaxID=2608880 RepID=UPI001F4745EE|nr:1,2-phenylacetyl-CoA epoxidase subunit PaaC [Foetidibacter luteolus]
MVNYILHLADNALVLGHRNSEWCGHGPALEQDIAISNIALDLIGQARNFYQYAAELMNNAGNNTVTEDSLAYLRGTAEYKNCLLVEQPNGDWGKTIARQFLFSAYQHSLFALLAKTGDSQLAAITSKAVKEVAYHLQWSAEWVIRLGDGTKESHARMQAALNTLWPFLPELFEPVEYEEIVLTAEFMINITSLKEHVMHIITNTLYEATLALPADTYAAAGGKQGRHSNHLEAMLTDMQYLQRTYPGCNW